MSQTGFHIYAYGVVTEDKPENTNIIKVLLKDITYGAEGDMNEKKDIDINTKNSEGIHRSDKISMGKTIPARWIAGNNRTSAPDVRKGETVKIYRYATNDDYYWEDMFEESELRGLETVSFAIKNTEAKEKINNTNSYYFTISTRNKGVTLHTSNNNGEPVSYDLDLDTKKGVLTIIDSRKNYIKLESTKDKLTANIIKEVDIITQTFNVHSEFTNIIATKEFTLTTPKATLNTNALALNADNADMNAKVLKINSTSHTINTTAYKMTSNAGTMTSTPNGLDFSKMLIAPDLKTTQVPTYNGHRHNETQSVTEIPF